MNERTLKLFMQACRHADYEHQNVPKELVEKFAELIVRECVNEIIKQNDDESIDDWDRGYVSGLRSATAVILKHFGVE